MSAEQRKKHRQAQAKYLANKVDRISQLEQQLNALRRTNDSHHPTCCYCLKESAKLEQSMTTLRRLRNVVANLEAKKSQLVAFNQLPSKSLSADLFSFLTVLPNPVEGIIHDIEVVRTELTALPSLRENPEVAELIRLRLEFDTLIGDQPRRIQFLKFEHTKFKLMDACTVLERKRVIEIIEWFRSRNRVIVSPVEDSRLSHPAPNAPLTSPAIQIYKDLSFRENMKRIASLKRVWDVIDYWSDEFHAWKGYTGCRTQRETQDFILRQNDFVRALARMCVGDDLIRFHLALEIGRASNKTLWDTLYREALEPSYFEK
ncbi:hypothetical protein HDU98_002076 [Podochytrium sp. JEL0797]|nr:hypothetical protein HDU98_002076 [Podochytrium sp. JEL0797]